MIIVWRDTELKEHQVDLSNAVDVKIDGVALAIKKNEGLRVKTNNPIIVKPIASNAIIVKEDK